MDKEETITETKRICYPFLLSLSVPSKCLAETRCKAGTIACTPAKTASSNQIIGCRTRVVFKASPTTPNATNRKLSNVETLFGYIATAIVPINWLLEFKADVTASKYVGKNAMKSALFALGHENSLNEPSETHPAINKRLKHIDKSKLT